MSELLYLPPSALRLHPSNIRRYYRPEDVAQMAASLQAHQGVIQALLIVPAAALGRADRALTSAESADVYYVVDGNLRLTAARTLAEQCPPLKCEVIGGERAQQLLVMAITSETVIPKDPISIALHYRRLRDEEGLSQRAIARALGHAENIVSGYLSLLDLDEPIQALIAQGDLPRDRRVRDALMLISDARARMVLAKRLAASGASIKAIVKSCETLAERLETEEAQRRSKVPALLHAAPAVPRVPQHHQVTPWSAVREATAATCAECEIRQSVLPSAPEPAWALVVEASEETCAACSVRDIKDACSQCPTVTLLAILMRKMAPGGAA